jgi:hypothetical protein
VTRKKSSLEDSRFAPTFPPLYRAYLSRRINIGNREILVFDGLFTQKTIRSVYQLLRMMPYTWDNVDSSASAHSIRWRLNAPREWEGTDFTQTIVRLTNKAMANGALRLGRVYANFNLYGEMHYEHIDGPYTITALYYANVEWERSWHGETFFCDRGEAAFVVCPVPGRLVVFDGRLEHRGSPPSRDCYEPRLTIALKFAPTDLPPTEPHRNPSHKMKARDRAPEVVKRHCQLVRQ